MMVVLVLLLCFRNTDTIDGWTKLYIIIQNKQRKIVLFTQQFVARMNHLFLYFQDLFATLNTLPQVPLANVYPQRCCCLM
uniref:Putative secreted protein n=1 Tax=Anopheles darlingi TaxID=43151 RepID=A0A2M4DDA8_ANODA